MRTTISLDHQPEPSGRSRVRMLMRVEAEEPAAGTRTPLDLALVLDRSGSMSGRKLAAATKAAGMLVRRLRAEDVIAVVAYDDQVVTVAEPATGAAQPDLARRIEAIRAGGSTNLSGGWLRGRELVARTRTDGAVRRVLLLTDGLANVGITDPASLVGLCAVARTEGITTTTIGVGEDYDETLLAAMADAGGGHTYFIESPDQAPAIFTEEIGDLLAVSAQNLRVTVLPSPWARIAIVHHAYPRTDVHGGACYDMGDLYAREPGVLLAEFLIEPIAAAADSVDVAELVVEADVIVDGGRIERREVRLPIRFSPAEGPSVDPAIRREVLLFEAARARREALERRARGDDDGAQYTLREASSLLELAAAGDAEIEEEARDLGGIADVFARHAVRETDVKYMHQRAYDQSRARRKKSELIARRKPAPAAPSAPPPEDGGAPPSAGGSAG
jgi:Ca-activated chloride channel family protein